MTLSQEFPGSCPPLPHSCHVCGLQGLRKAPGASQPSAPSMALGSITQCASKSALSVVATWWFTDPKCFWQQMIPVWFWRVIENKITAKHSKPNPAAQHPDNSNSWVWTLPNSGFQRFLPFSHADWSSGFCLNPGQGPESEQEKKKCKKKTPILLDRNSPTMAAGRFKLTWSGKDSECQRKTGNKIYKKERRAEPLIWLLLPW